MDVQRNHAMRQRVTVFLDRQQVDFLDKMGKDAWFTHGNKLSRIKIISCLVNLLMELDINATGVSSIEELKRRIEKKIGSGWPTTKQILALQQQEHKKKERTE